MSVMGAQSLCANSEMCVGVRMREGWREESLDDKRNGPCIPDSLFHSPDSGRAEKVFFFQIFYFSLSLSLSLSRAHNKTNSIISTPFQHFILRACATLSLSLSAFVS